MKMTQRILIMAMFLGIISTSSAMTHGTRVRDIGIKIGVMQPGTHNAITDVPGVRVGHVTLNQGKDIRTGVTAILPHAGNMYQQKVPAAMYIGNGFGKLAGYSQVEELGTLETPIILTNTLSVPAACEGLITHTLNQEGNEEVRSVNAVVGETNDGYLSDIRARHIKEKHILKALKNATDGPVQEGSVGAGTGTSCFGFKGGIGTASRVLPEKLGGWTIGVLTQTNFGGVLQIAGVPVGVELGEYSFKKALETSPDGSCMMVIMTDAPLDARNLKRLAKRGMMGLAKTGGIASNGSGDYVIAVSTAESVRVAAKSDSNLTSGEVLRNDAMSPLFMAAIEATEEAILNSLFMSTTMEGRDGHVSPGLPVEAVKTIMTNYRALSP